MEPLRKPCPACRGSGVMPRTRRLIDGVPDAFDQRTEELCMRCGGSGKVRDAGPAKETPKATAVAAHDDCCMD